MPNWKAMPSMIADATLKFRVPKTVIVQDRRVGGLFRFLQFAIFVYIVIQLWAASQWAYSEMPDGVVNAWPESGNWEEEATEMDEGTLLYCDNPDFSYSYSAGFVMANPKCEKHHPYEVSSKGDQRVDFISAFIEIREVAWPAGGIKDIEFTALCNERGGNVTTSGSQRYCKTQRTVYPVGVEKMVVAFEHAYKPSHPESRFKHMYGGSNAQPGDPDAVDSCFAEESESGQLVCKTHMKSGKAVSRSVGEWLSMAGVSSLNNMNTKLTADYLDGTTYPSMRSAGVSVEVTVTYDNRNQDNMKPEADRTLVWAAITAKANTEVWSGSGPSTHYESYPELDDSTGAYTYDKIFKYRQAVIFKFRTTGLLYKMEWTYVLQALLNSLVLLTAAHTLTIYYALYLHPLSTMMQNATITKFSAKRRMAEIGMKGALAALQFEFLDTDKDEVLELHDLVGVFARIKDVTFEQAYAIAHMVICDAQIETAEQKKARASLQASNSNLSEVQVVDGNDDKLRAAAMGDKKNSDGGIDFGKFFLASEGGTMIPWEKYLLLAPDHAKDLTKETSQEAKEKCKDVYDRVFAEEESKRKADAKAAWGEPRVGA